MNKNKRHIFICFSLICCLSLCTQEQVYAQIGTQEQTIYLESDLSKKEISKDTWKAATEGLDYTKKNKKKKKEPRDRSNRRRNNREPIFNPFDFSNGAADFFRFLFVLIAVSVGAFILFRIMGGKVILSNKRVRQSTDFNIEELDEETIKETELDRYLREAIQKKDYRLAIRIYYLEVLKQLTISRFISFKKDKTNREYINEMRPSTHYEGFREITLAFDKAWYGEKDITSNDFDAVSPKFQSLIKAVQI